MLSKKGNRIINSLLFVLGFGIVFVVLGALASAAGEAFAGYKWLIVKISGMIMILMGLVMLDLSPDFLKRIFIPLRSIGNKQYEKSTFIFGMVLSVSFTPCIGPVLSSILALASAQKTFFNGVVLLILYTIGFLFPFFVSSIFLERMKNILSILNKNIRIFEYITATLMILFGALIFFDMVNIFR